MFRLQTQLISNQFLCYLNTHFQRVKTFYQAFYKALKAVPSPANRFLPANRSQTQGERDTEKERKLKYLGMLRYNFNCYIQTHTKIDTNTHR